MEYYWRIDDGRIWGAQEAGFVAAPPPGAVLTPLMDGGRPGGLDYLRETIRFYGGGLGELAETEDLARPIVARLAEIDAESIRPQRAITAGTATEADHRRLTDLETEAARLRGELSDLRAQVPA